jgi:hypothetical protein
MKQVLRTLLLAALVLALPGTALAQDRGASERFNEKARAAYDRAPSPRPWSCS